MHLHTVENHNELQFFVTGHKSEHRNAGRNIPTGPQGAGNVTALSIDAGNGLNAQEELEAVLELLAFHLNCKIPTVVRLLYRMDNEAKGKILKSYTNKKAKEIVMEVFLQINGLTWSEFVATRLSLLRIPKAKHDAFWKEGLALPEMFGTRLQLQTNKV